MKNPILTLLTTAAWFSGWVFYVAGSQGVAAAIVCAILLGVSIALGFYCGVLLPRTKD